MSKPTVKYTFLAEPEDVPVRGNVMASGDDAADKAAENEVLARLERGDIYAWFVAHVIAEVEVDGETYKGDAYLGGCSYADEKNFTQDGGYYDDMKKDAFNDLIATLRSRVKAGELAARALAALEAP